MGQFQFPSQFRWGAATASYQIEGATREDGRGESIWDRFCATPGHILNNETGDTACDHYHRYREDIQLMQELGLNAYRFSIAWSRILPAGRGQINEAGLDFYERLVDELLAAHIEPFATLFHWDLPQALQDEWNGWQSRQTAAAFAEYADIVSRRLGDRVRQWITLNEPYVCAFMGHESGEFAPGLADARVAWQVSHNLLLAHGLAVPILRTNGDPQTRVGITLSLSPTEPATSSQEDQLLAQFADGKLNRWFLDPVFKGSYPADMLALLPMLGVPVPEMAEGDAAIIAQPLDFLGVNYYFRTILHQAEGKPLGEYSIIHPEGAEYTAMGWEVNAPSLHALLVRLHKDYAIPAIYITENGAAFEDVVSEDGQVHDVRRTNYLQEHIAAVAEAMQEGVPVEGYFTWSLMDNFEWSSGYSKRFGMIYTDYPTQRRIIKDSGYWYRDKIRSA